jgi:hypothetical protein
MGKTMVNAINLVAHVTIMAHLNLKTTVAFVTKSNSCCAAMWHIINGKMKNSNPNPNPNTNTCKVEPCDTWHFKLPKY